MAMNLTNTSSLISKEPRLGTLQNHLDNNPRPSLTKVKKCKIFKERRTPCTLESTPMLMDC